LRVSIGSCGTLRRGAFVLCTLMLFGFVYWQTAAYGAIILGD
jgi:hypothetical protein